MPAMKPTAATAAVMLMRDGSGMKTLRNVSAAATAQVRMTASRLSGSGRLTIDS